MREKAIELLKQGLSVKEVKQILNLSDKKWKKLDLVKLNRYNNIFDNITEESAYWLGFLWADGSLSKDTLELEINLNDLHHLEKLANSLSLISKVPIYKRFRNNSYTCRISIKNKDIADSLRNLGFNKKALRIIPNISEEYMNHFVRGYFDGDGSLQINSNRTILYRADISGVDKTIEYIEQFLPKYNYSQYIKNRTWNSKRIYWTNKESIEELFNYLLKDATIYLERKYLMPVLH